MARLRTSGFTLTELLIAVAIVGILAMIALPSYQESVRKTRRSDAKAALNNIAQRLERCRTQFGTFNDAGCVVSSPQDSPERYYTVTTVRTATTYTLTATPQAADRCTTLTLNELGQRGSTGADVATCW